MRIEFERTGGFAGLTMRNVIDLDNLPQEDANRLRQLIEKSNFFKLPGSITSSAPGVDRFHYAITVKSDGRKHTVEVDEAALPSEMKPLLQWLTATASKH